jgi:hypothetical protein
MTKLPNTAVQIYEERGLGFVDVSSLKLLIDGLGINPRMRACSIVVFQPCPLPWTSSKSERLG